MRWRYQKIKLIKVLKWRLFLCKWHVYNSEYMKEFRMIDVKARHDFAQRTHRRLGRKRNSISFINLQVTSDVKSLLHWGRRTLINLLSIVACDKLAWTSEYWCKLQNQEKGCVVIWGGFQAQLSSHVKAKPSNHAPSPFNFPHPSKELRP